MKDKIIAKLEAINRLQKELLRNPSSKEDAFFQGFNKGKIEAQITKLESELSSLKAEAEKEVSDEDYKAKYKKCIKVIKKFDAGIIGMYDL